MALGIYIGFKPAYRRPEMTRHGVDYDAAMDEFHKVGLAKNNRLVKMEARAAFQDRFPDQLGSQTHQYCHTLGYPPVGYY
jgi:hypothetical protein